LKYHKGIVQIELNNYNDALKQLDDALTINPKFAEALNARAVVLSHNGNHHETIEELKKTIEYKPSLSTAGSVNFHLRASKELADFLTTYQYEENGKKYVKAYAFSMVDTPNNLFDKFGRAVCDIVISDPGININQWLIEKGWAFPDFRI
jgi:tetratricopeptide (TPR) repeat protein